MACGKTYRHRRVNLSRQQLQLIFKNHDRDGDGRLSAKELTEAFRFLGALLPPLRARHALFYADSDGDGFVTEKEFETLLNYAEKCKYTVA